MDNLFEYYIETEKFHLKYAKGEPAVKEQEFHNYNEFVLFIDGYSSLVSKNIQQKLTHGSLVIIPKEHFHHFYVEQPHTYERLIIGFCETTEINGLVCEVMDTIKVIPIPDVNVFIIFESLIKIVKSDICDEDKKLFVYSALMQLLIYLKHSSFGVISKNVLLSFEVSQALSIIDEKFNENLSVGQIAKALCVSTSTLSHKFSKELNISPYRYITKKRLIEAHKLIKNNEPLSSAAIKSGFCDYSCFYRLYKKYYK